MDKAHKAGTPLRPIISMIRTPEHNLAKFLDNSIKPCMPDTYLLKSTERFMNEVKQFNFTKNQTVVSFDVFSLFTNVGYRSLTLLTSY